MKIASFPPSKPRPSTSDAARHIAEEARLVLTSLRGGPPYIALGELAMGLREMRAYIRGRSLDENVVGSSGGGGENGDYYSNPHSNLGAAAGATVVPSLVGTAKMAPRQVEEEDSDNKNNDGDEASVLPPQIRIPPPLSPDREANGAGNKIQIQSPLPPPPLPPVFDEENNANNAEANSPANKKEEPATAALPEQRPHTPPASPTPLVSPPTPHSVPPPSSDDRRSSSFTSVHVPSIPVAPNNNPTQLDSSQISQLQQQHHQQERQQQPLDPGPYATPFLAVIVDPRAAGPHTLVALRALHRLLERGSILQLTGGSGNSNNNNNASEGNVKYPTDNASPTATGGDFAHETTLEPIARGVLACRFEQTDAGADEAVEMAIADLLNLLVELDAAGARATEAALLRQVYVNKAAQKRATSSQQQKLQQQTQQQQLPSDNKSSKRGTTLWIQRLPSSVLMESFHAVYVTRLTFVRDGGGHHSPALSFHFEQVLLRMIHCVFGGEDAQSKVKKSGVISSKHVSAARKILEFLINNLSHRKYADASGGDKWNAITDPGDDGRTLCLRLIQCCLRTGWGNGAFSVLSEGAVAKSTDIKDSLEYENMNLSRLVEDDLCLALLTTGQAIWSHHDEVSGGHPPNTPSSSSSGGLDSMGMLSPSVSLGLLSEVCATLSLLWSLPKLRPRLRCQFESIFTGFYQRALSLLRRRPLPEYGVIYEANIAFDAEAEVILESLVDVLCLSSNSGVGLNGKSLSTAEELFLTYDCSNTESDVASGLLLELSRCCGGVVDEEGEPYLPSPMGLSRASSNGASSGAPTPVQGTASPMMVARYRSVPDHLKELCFEALLGSLRRLFHGAESLGEPSQAAKDKRAQTSHLRTAKNRKRSLHHAAALFNEKPKKGLQYLIDNGMLPSPSTPESVASFLRNGLVVGLDKPAVGQYLGELGKSEKDSSKSTPAFERDWFHKALLESFCSSFAFQNLTVLDGLRMFLATFRLPGEAQMIDRILQAFAESISRQCVESTGLKVFSTDEKKASDAAYLLSFSIIMLNTDLHNDNIRADRKMKLKDFIRNNKNYGKEISDEDFPVEYLEGIYRGIKEEQIRTLGEGADGSMTGERWKDVMRSEASSSQSRSSERRIIQSDGGAKDLKELLLESSWQPILSAVSGLWGMVPWEVYQADVGGGGSGAAAPVEHQNGTTLVGARLGIDLAYEILSGASNLSRHDILQDVFTNICYMSGLVSEYNRSTEDRAHTFLSSIEHQSALTVAVIIAEENGDTIGLDGWKFVWRMIFELRDFQLLSGGEGSRQHGHPNVMKESDPDLLSPEARDGFCQRMAQWGGDGYSEAEGGRPHKQQGMSLMSLVFGSSESLDERKNGATPRSLHGKEEFLVWDDLASSDDEEEDEHTARLGNDTEYLPFPSERYRRMLSIGASFENQLVYERTLDPGEIGGVTGLERIDVGHSTPNSSRARVRQRLSQLVDFHALISESRYLSEEGLSDTLNSLVEIISDSSKKTNISGASENGDKEASVELPLSPASEAFAEILLCEIALKNRDRFALIWNNILRAHYNSRLTYRPSHGDKEGHQPETIKLTPGIEKCVSGILRLCIWASNGRDTSIANQVLSTLNILHPPLGALIWSPLELNLDKHLAEGLWRISRNVDGLSQIDAEGWGGILGLVEWCATRGGLRSKIDDQLGNLAEDDPSLQAFRSLHLILHAVELKDSLQAYRWPQIVRSVRSLVEAGERGHCPKLSIAGLDLLHVLHTRMETLAAKGDSAESQHLLSCWVPILEAICEPAEKSRNGSVRQQAISLLTDTLLDRHGSRIPVDRGLCEIMNNICIPLAGERITDLLSIPYDVQNDLEETLIELELCISLLFKPFLHHLKALISVKQEFIGIWISMLGVMTQLLGEESLSQSNDHMNGALREDGAVTRAKLFQTTKELGSEHLRNAIMVLAAMGMLVDNDNDDSTNIISDGAQEISSVTWAAIGSIGYCKPYLEEWKSSACQ